MTLQRIHHAGAMAPTTLSGNITAGSSSLTLNAATGAPATPFVIKIDAGTAAEEKILIGSLSGTSCTSLTRGYDGTSPTSHSNSAAIEHDLAAVVIDDVNDHVYNTSRDDHTQLARTDGTRAFTGGVTVNTGGLTVAAGGLTVSAGGAAITGAVSSTSTIQGTALAATLAGSGRYVGATNGAPSSGTYSTGDFASDPTHAIYWICTTGGTPGTWKPCGTGLVQSIVYRNAAWTTASPIAPFVFDTVWSDPLTLYNTSTGTFTCPFAGSYRVTATVRYTAASTTSWMALHLIQTGVEVTNGSVYCSPNTGPGFGSALISAVVPCAANDTLVLSQVGSTAGMAGTTSMYTNATFELAA